jgi:pimeloyl-ACP methyl ester carboxylesterase
VSPLSNAPQRTAPQHPAPGGAVCYHPRMRNCLAHVRRTFVRGAWLAQIFACALVACSDRNTVRRVELTDCRVPKLASAARCASIEVPEDRTLPDGRRIAVAATVLAANTLSPKPDPLFMLAGGPGQSSAALAPLAGVLAGVRRDRDIVLIDPRGSGKSAPLSCAALAPRDPLDDFGGADIADAAGRCLREITAAGSADVAQYTTSALVDDVDAVRAALGYERINLWGGSYGTRVALEYLRRHPQRVRAMVLDGVAPPGLRINLDAWPARDAALASLFGACAGQAACRTAYPDLNATLAAIGRDLATGRRVTVADPRTGDARELLLTFDMVVGALHALMYAPELASLVPPLLERVQAGDYAPLVAATLLATDDSGRTMNQPLYFAVTCAEDASRIGADEAAQTISTLRAPALAERKLAACKAWPRPPLPRDFGTPVASDKPVLILSGGLDPVTPPANGRKVAESLANSRHVVAAGYGHIVSPHACTPRLIEKFIDEAGFETLPQSCLDYLATSTRPPLFSSRLQNR